MLSESITFPDSFMDLTLQDRIDRYLRGEMTAAETQIFEQEAINTHSLLKELEFTLLVKKAIADRQHKLQLMRRWHHRKAVRFAKLAGALTVAALLVVGFVAVKPFSATDVPNPMVKKRNAKETIAPSAKSIVAQPGESVRESTAEKNVATPATLQQAPCETLQLEPIRNANRNAVNVMSHTQPTSDSADSQNADEVPRQE